MQLSFLGASGRHSIEEKLKWQCYVPEYLERVSLD
jgi:hypothetical protein